VGGQGWKKSAHAEEPQLQRNYDGVLEFVRRDLQDGSLDAVGHTELRQRPANADHGHGAWSGAIAVPEGANRDGFFEAMKMVFEREKERFEEECRGD
jgi:hypothetical protein